jgi:hypothetical protein
MRHRVSAATDLRDPLRDAGSLLLVVGGLALCAAGLGQVPLLGRPDPRPHPVRTMQEAEEVLGARLLLPAYFPDAFAWPPAGLTAGRRPSPWVAMAVARRDGGRGIVVAQAIGRDPPAPRAAGRLVRREAVAVGDGAAELEVRADGGRETAALRWRHGERRLLLAGPERPETLLRIATAMRPRVVTEAR